MAELAFIGNVVNGIGRHAELFVPGRDGLKDAPADWPETLHPGSLNIRVATYSEAFADRGLPHATTALDRAGFEPAFFISGTLMGNNRLTSTAAMPERGTAQVWRAALKAGQREVPCWVLRRFGSGLKDQIELVSAIALRAELGLSREREWPATVTVFGRWASEGAG
jgi:hypothetical protein